MNTALRLDSDDFFVREQARDEADQAALDDARIDEYLRLHADRSLFVVHLAVEVLPPYVVDAGVDDSIPF
jgi:hypothetical protein